MLLQKTSCRSEGRQASSEMFDPVRSFGMESILCCYSVDLTVQARCRMEAWGPGFAEARIEPEASG